MSLTDTQFRAMLKEAYPQLTRSEKQVAEFLAENMQVAAFLTCVEFGRAAGVSDTTVIRLATILGFDGYAQMKKSLQGIMRKKLSSQDKLSDTISKVGGSNYLQEILELEKQNLEQTFARNDPQEIQQAVEMIGGARKVFAMGLGLSVAAVRFLSLRLRRIGMDVVELTAGGFALVEKMACANEKDVLVAFDFPKYSKEVNHTLKFMQREIGARTILICDTHLGKHTANADLILTVKNESLGFINTITGSAMLSNMLSVGVALLTQDDSLEQLSMNQKFAELLGHSF